MKVSNMLWCGLAVALLTSCGKTEHSTAYYMQHPDERDAMVAKCRADPDLIAKDSNCQSAGSAQFRAGGNVVSSPPKNWTFDGPASAASGK